MGFLRGSIPFGSDLRWPLRSFSALNQSSLITFKLNNDSGLQAIPDGAVGTPVGELCLDFSYCIPFFSPINASFLSPSGDLGIGLV